MQENAQGGSGLVRSRASERMAKAIVLAGFYGSWAVVMGLIGAMWLLAR